MLILGRQWTGWEVSDEDISQVLSKDAASFVVTEDEIAEARKALNMEKVTAAARSDSGDLEEMTANASAEIKRQLIEAKVIASDLTGMNVRTALAYMKQVMGMLAEGRDITKIEHGGSPEDFAACEQVAGSLLNLHSNFDQPGYMIESSYSYGAADAKDALHAAARFYRENENETACIEIRDRWTGASLGYFDADDTDVLEINNNFEENDDAE